MSRYYPVFLELKGKECVVIGGGKVAERKVEALLEAGAIIKVISPELTSKLKKLAEEGKIFWEKKKYEKGDIEGAWLVIAATDNPAIQKKIYEEAEEKRIFCNVVDVPEFCSFIVHSVVKRGDLQIAISTSGASPAVARRLREQLEELFGEEYEVYLKLMRNLRKQVLEKGFSQDKKEEILQNLALAPIPKYIKNKDLHMLKTLITKLGLILPSDLFS